MNEYFISHGETISDIALNSGGAIAGWHDILQLNNLDTWTPVLQPGVRLLTPGVIDNTFFNEIQKAKAVNNIEITDLFTQLIDFENTLNAISVIDIFTLPEKDNKKITYVVKQGETISDIILNSTGTILNWQTILNANANDDWTPILIPGHKINIAYDEIQRNVLKGLEIIPAVNNIEITDFDIQVNDLIHTFVSNEYLFDDELTGYLFDDDNESYLFSN